MAKLTTAARRAVPTSEFGLPGSRKYPMPDRAHAANAKARATQQVKAGNLSAASAAKIRAKANRILGVFVLFALFALPAIASPDTFQVTIGAAATQISSTNLYCSSWTIQNNAAHSIRFGDSTVTSSKGLLLAAGTPGGSFTSPASRNGSQPAPDNLSQWYIAGTQNDVIDVTCDQVVF